MAKTKRRQLAALAAQAELKEFVGTNERTSSCHKSGSSGTIPQAGDPNVEIRTQRVIFKIPALPPKPAADTQSLKIAAKKEVLGKRRRKKPQIDVDLSSDQVPADGAKISKGIIQSGKWKRHKKIRDLLPNGEQAVPSSAGIPNRDQPSPAAKSTSPAAKSIAHDTLQNGELHFLVAGSERQPEKRVKFVTGSEKRAKLQDMVIRSPAEKESKLIETQGKSKPNIVSEKPAKLQEVVARSPAEEGKSVENEGKSKTIISSQKRAKPQEVVVRSPAKRGRKLMETQGKSKAIVTGSKKRAKPQEVVVRSPAAERESKSTETQGKSKATTDSQKRAKLQEVVVRSPTKKESKLMGTRGKSKEAVESSALNKAASPKRRRSRDFLVKDPSRSSQELAQASNGDLSPSALAHSPAPWKRTRGNFQNKVIPPQVLPASPKATVISHHRTRSRAKDISYCEAMALEVLQEIQNVKNISQQMENRGKIAAANDTMLVRGAADGEATYNSTRDQSQEQPENGGNFTSPVVHGKSQLACVGVTSDSLSDVVRSGLPTSYHTCLQGDAPEDLKSQFRMEMLHVPVDHGEQRGVLLVGPLQDKDTAKSAYSSGGNCKHIVREAEIIKRDSQLAIMEKRLKAAGGLRKWLLDMHLDQFVPILEKWNIDSLSLMQLTMEGLRSMGFLPVGPRRKLIHAISSLTVPSFTQASLVTAKPS